jgi:hypothetical protein
MPLGESKNAPAVRPVAFRNPRRDFANSFIAFSLQDFLTLVACPEITLYHPSKLEREQTDMGERRDRDDYTAPNRLHQLKG